MACVFKFFDIFGNSFSPTVSYQSKTNTVFGGIFGIIYIAISLFLIYQVGRSMIDKVDPTIVEEDIIDKDTEVNFTLPITFSIWVNKRYVKGVNFNPEETDKEIEFIKNNLQRLITYKAGYTNMTLTKAIPFKTCNIYDFHDDPTPYEIDIINKLQCLDLSNATVSLYHSFGVPTVRSLELSLWMCENTTDYNNCFSYEEQDHYLRTFDFRYLYYFAGYDYKPRIYGNKVFRKFLDLFYSKLIYIPNFFPATHYLKIQNVKLYTDVGVFGEELEYLSSQRISGVTYLVGGDPYETDAGDLVYRRKMNQLVIFVDKSTKKITRKYPKIHEIIANVAGIVSILGFCMQFFLQKIYDSKTYEIILHQLFDINEDLIDEIPKKKNLGSDKSKEKEVNQMKDSINLDNIIVQNNNINDLNKNETTNPKFKRKSELEKINEDYKQNNNSNQKRSSILNFNIENVNLKMEGDNNPANTNYLNAKLDNSENRLFKINEIDSGILPEISPGAIQGLSTDIPPKSDPSIKQKTSKYIINNSDFSWKNQRQKKYDAEFKLVPENKIPTAVKCLNNSKGKDNEKSTNYNYNISNTKICLLSFCDHLLITYFKCCLVGRTSKINKYYEELRDIVFPYTDILNITNNIFEMEKLKYLLMDEDQVAVFNYRSKIEVSNCYLNGSKFNNFYYFMKDLNDNVDVEQIKNELVDRDNQKRFNLRLKNLSV